MLGKIVNGKNFEMFFLFFQENGVKDFMQIVCLEDPWQDDITADTISRIDHKIAKPHFLIKSRKCIVSILPDEVTQRMLKVHILIPLFILSV